MKNGFDLEREVKTIMLLIIGIAICCIALGGLIGYLIWSY
ncbi:nitrate reductase NapE component [Pullulanibacillus pueri]|nr:nitrate reductase NapE component [Pullulanibacillus pueri]